MKKIGYFLLFAMLLTSAISWAAPVKADVTPGGPAVITASVDTVAFGNVVVGYKVTKQLTVTGLNLTDDLTLTISDDRFEQYTVSPGRIAPEKAAQGVTVTVTVSPYNPYTRTAMLTLSSVGAEDVIIPITIDINRAECLPSYNQLTASVGRLTSLRGTINFPDAEVPHDPDSPVVMSPMAGYTPVMQVAPGTAIGDYSYTIQGDACFGVMITKGSAIAKTCDVVIHYCPAETGTHHATITFSCSRGGIPVTVHVSGTALEAQPGDVNGDGFMTISDATELLDILLSPNDRPTYADVNNDGAVSIIDITSLIDMLLMGNK